MTLLEKQQIFSLNVAKLILFIYQSGRAVTLGEASRSPEQAERNEQLGIGIANSLHVIRLAIDLNLFYDHTYLRDSEDYEPVGEYWKTLHPLNCWGGDFKRPDGNHFSMEHEGVK